MITCNRSSLMLIGAFFGLLTGYSQLPSLLVTAQYTAHIFKNLLELISIPVIFLSIMATITGIEGTNELKRLGRKVLTYTLLTTILSGIVALLLYIGLNPAGTVIAPVDGSGVAAGTASYAEFFLGIVPSNLVGAFTSTSNITAVVFLALLLSTASLMLDKEDKELLHTGFRALFNMMLQVTQFILFLMPFGVWAFVTQFTQSLLDNQFDVSQIGLYLTAVVGANVIQGLLVLPVLLWYHGINPFRLFSFMRPALTLAFLSKSSNATLPVTLKCATDAGISKRVSSFTLPLCSTVNMNGCAAFILITVLFVGSINGVAFSSIDMLTWVLLATVAAVGNAGVPMGCFFLASAFLAHMQVPLTMMGVILPLYALIDMIETALNVWSDSCVAAIVDTKVD